MKKHLEVDLLSDNNIVGRFAPTPSGRMHLGNVMCALVSWLSARSVGGSVLLRIEDLDAYRCAWEENTAVLIDDLNFLGLTFDGGYDRSSWQSAKSSVYQHELEKLRDAGLIYPCSCSRAELHADRAPHASDGSYVYSGKCYQHFLLGVPLPSDRPHSLRVHVPDLDVDFHDLLCGYYSENLKRDCGDFIVRRADGVFAYQLAVIVDDCLSGVTEVCRGHDLLSSTPRQLWLARMLGLKPPHNYIHIPLLTDQQGRRLSKRDLDLDMGALRNRYKTPEPILGIISASLGLIDRPEPIELSDLLYLYSLDKIPKDDIRLVLPDGFYRQ